jgi:4-amino-4-deoxy-L-arabinose transferase-like glycosyltransferase
MLVFTLVLATWMLMRGVRRGKWGWVVAAFGMIGVAFNMKMLQAYMVVPAFYLFYSVGGSRLDGALEPLPREIRP